MKTLSEMNNVSEMSCDEILQMTTEDHRATDLPTASDDILLTESVAREYLRRGNLSLSEVMALLSGTHPQASRRGACETFLQPKGQDIPAAARMLNDIDSGRVGMPMLSREFVEWCMEWKNQLPDALDEALKQVDDIHRAKVDEQQISKPRANASADALAEVVRCMDDAEGLIKATKHARGDNKMPGTKAPFREYLRNHSLRLKDLGNDRLDEYLNTAGFRWAQAGSGRRETDISLRRVLGLPQVDRTIAQPSSIARGKLNGRLSTWLDDPPCKF